MRKKTLKLLLALTVIVLINQCAQKDQTGIDTITQNNEEQVVATKGTPLPPLGTKTYVSGTPSFPASAIFKKPRTVSGGASGTQIIVEVDTNRAKYYTPQPGDAYYMQFYGSFWQNGQHAKSQLPYSVPYNGGVVGFQNGSYYTKGSSSFQNAKWYDSYYYGGGSNVVHHIQNKIVGTSQTWLPNGAGVGTNYVQLGNSANNVTMNFRAELGRRVMVGSTVVEWSQKVLAGEVTEDGWGLVPATKDIPAGKGFYQWMWMIPSGASFKVHGQSGYCPGKSCVYQTCAQGTCSTYCWDDQYHVTHLVDPPLPLPLADWWTSYNGTIGLGGGTTPDYSAEGKFYWIGKDGYITELPAAAAKIYAGYTGWVNVNGSNNNLSDAQKSSVEMAKAAGKNLVLVYMAQNLNYANPTNNYFNQVFADLMANYDKSYGNNITVTSHSWAGHLVQNIVKNNANVTHIAINPAHSPTDTLTWIANMNSMSNKLQILYGTQDVVTLGAGGTAYLENGVLLGAVNVYNAITGKYNITVQPVNYGWHTINSMLQCGMMGYITPKIPR